MDPGGGHIDGDEAPPPRDPVRVVVAAYLLAAVCALVPLAVVGALFAGVALMRRNRPGEGAGIVALAVAATALGVLLLR
jgi:hypothetical protein